MFGELLVEPYFWNKSPLWTLEDLFHQHTTSSTDGVVQPATINATVADRDAS